MPIVIWLTHTHCQSHVHCVCACGINVILAWALLTRPFNNETRFHLLPTVTRLNKTPDARRICKKCPLCYACLGANLPVPQCSLHALAIACKLVINTGHMPSPCCSLCLACPAAYANRGPARERNVSFLHLSLANHPMNLESLLRLTYSHDRSLRSQTLRELLWFEEWRKGKLLLT